jgi:hypothetical protein
MTVYDEIPDGLDLREQTLICIGRFIADWANCESSFSWIFSKLIGRANGNADIVWLAIISLEARLDLLWALVKFETAIAPETKDELKGCIDEFREVSSLRNYYCHAVYTTDADMNLLSVDKWRLAKPKHTHAFTEQRRPVSEKSLKELCTAIDKCVDINKRIIQAVSALETQL